MGGTMAQLIARRNRWKTTGLMAGLLSFDIDALAFQSNAN
jgi:hypothetical protein